ncbi:hypothetical protein PMAYCL1PPCAC_16406, partial [Pristionchus mayeri]
AHRTLLYIKDAAGTPERGELTLAVHVNFTRSFDTIDRMSLWPGPVSLVVYGSDHHRMLLNNFLHKNKNGASERMAVHFVHPTIGDSVYPAAYLAKIAVDAARTERVLAAYELEDLDVSMGLYSKFQNLDDEHSEIAIIQSEK